MNEDLLATLLKTRSRYLNMLEAALTGTLSAIRDPGDSRHKRFS